jgi:hypothetical protein
MIFPTVSKGKRIFEKKVSLFHPQSCCARECVCWLCVNPERISAKELKNCLFSSRLDDEADLPDVIKFMIDASPMD